MTPYQWESLISLGSLFLGVAVLCYGMAWIQSKQFRR